MFAMFLLVYVIECINCISLQSKMHINLLVWANFRKTIMRREIKHEIREKEDHTLLYFSQPWLLVRVLRQLCDTLSSIKKLTIKNTLEARGLLQYNRLEYSRAHRLNAENTMSVSIANKNTCYCLLCIFYKIG